MYFLQLIIAIAAIGYSAVSLTRIICEYMSARYRYWDGLFTGDAVRCNCEECRYRRRIGARGSERNKVYDKVDFSTLGSQTNNAEVLQDFRETLDDILLRAMNVPQHIYSPKIIVSKQTLDWLFDLYDKCGREYEQCALDGFGYREYMERLP